MSKGTKKRARRNKVTEGGDDPEAIPDPPTSVAADKEGDPNTLTLGESRDDQSQSSTLLAKAKKQQPKRHKTKTNPVMGGGDPGLIPDPPISVAADEDGKPSTLSLGVSRDDQSPSATLLPKAKQKQSKRHKTKTNPVMGGDDPEVIPDPPTSVVADKEGDKHDDVSSATSSGFSNPVDVAEHYNYDPPFTIYERFINDNEWNLDADIARRIEIFPATGERRKKQVKDDFDWLLPSTRPADRNAAIKAYESKYNFTDGFQSSNQLCSSTKYCIPASVDDRVISAYELHHLVMDHSLCNMEEDSHWLIKPVGNLINRIHSAETKPPTRSSIHDASLGQDIFLHSAYVAAEEFVSSMDDVELIDFVGNTTKKIWHCSDICKSMMLSKAILAAYKDAVFDDKRYEPAPLWKTLLAASSKKDYHHHPIQFLGLVSLFQTKSETMVTAFRLHSFLLYCYLPKAKMTRVHLILTESKLVHSSVQERLLQILQMLQSDQVGTSALVIAPDFQLTSDLRQAYTYLGFYEETNPADNSRLMFRRNSVIKLAKFTNRTLWGRFGKYLSLPGEPDEGSDPLLNFMCRIVFQLMLRPINSTNSFGMKFNQKLIDEKVSLINQVARHDKDQCFVEIMKVAVELTHIPFAVFTHAIINRLKSGKTQHKVIHETTLELIQYVSIALVNVAPYHKSYIGDCHLCSLYCEKCKQKFGLPGNIFKVLAEASNTILFHHGLELDELKKSDEYENMNDQRFMNSLPMHTMSHLMGKFSISIIHRLHMMDNQRCKYGTGKELSRVDDEKNIQYLHGLHEAMKIDTYFAGNETILQQRVNHTSALLLSLFDVAHHRYCEDVVGQSNESKDITFDEYAVQLESAVDTGEKWIQSNCDKELFNQYRILQGWCLLLTQQMLLNFGYLCKKVCRSYDMATSQSFRAEELMSKIGLDNRCPKFLGVCQQYDMSFESVQDFTTHLVNLETQVPVTYACFNRPVQEDVLSESLAERGTISKLGSGWDRAKVSTWFNTNSNIKNTTNKVQNFSGRKITTIAEAKETVYILQSLSSILLEYDNEYGKGYSMTCNVNDMIKKNPSLLTGPYKSFFEKPTFECSNSLVTSLPFGFVEKLRVGKDTPLPKTWRNTVKNDAIQSESNNIKSIQLWRHRMITKDSKIKIERTYLVEYDTNVGQKSIKTAYVKDEVATYFLQKEPWILDNVKSLCAVRSYMKLIFGEGAKSSKDELQFGHESDGMKKNFWYSENNSEKLCAEGSVANLLFHMNLQNDAVEFRQISSITTINELKVAMGVDAIPKRMLNNRHHIDPIEKCIWILEKRFNCRRYGWMLNTSHFRTANQVVNYLSPIMVPVILSVSGKNSLFNHVVVVWRNKIIDFESQYTYQLTVANVDRICGPKNSFSKINRGYMILPSRQMKISMCDLSDWGESIMRGTMAHLFSK